MTRKRYKTIRISDGELQTLKEQAAKSGINDSQYIRMALRRLTDETKAA